MRLIIIACTKKTVHLKNNQNRIDIIRHLTQAFYIGFNYKFQKLTHVDDKNKQELLSDRFLELGSENFKKNQSLDFYSKKLCYFLYDSNCEPKRIHR